jgi:hypothetical protein
MLLYFPDRYDGKLTPDIPLKKADAESLRDIALKARFEGNERELYEKWETARRHLNELEIIAFAYC